VAYISEIKSKDDPTGASDYIEIVLEAGDDPADFSITVYNRNGDVRSTIELNSGTQTGTAPSGEPIYSISTGVWEGNSPIGPAAIALESDDTGLVQFVAVGGSDVSPTTGIAAGETAIGQGNSSPGESHFWNSSNDYLGIGPSTPGIVCFTKGAFMETKTGPRLVEDLCVGDLIQTRDNGFQSIRWIGTSHKTALDLHRTPALQPIKIAKHAFGDNCPDRDMAFSPQHHVLMTGPQAEMLFGETEVLVAAKHLVNDTSIQPVLAQKATYIHIMFDTHQIVKSDNLWSESFLPGDCALGNLHAAERIELLQLFPELSSSALSATYKAVRPILNKHESLALLKTNI
jgi:hypothetical protein